MRNPLERLVRRDQPKVPLRERLDAVKTRLAAGKAKAKRLVAVNRILLQPEPWLEPPVDRAALVNYASWLFMERRLVCLELYPHLGARATSFVVEALPANAFHFPPGGDWRAVPKPSTRAVKILDMLGIDWRSERDPDWDATDLRDNGERPSLPHGWPRVDAALLEALDDLARIDRALAALGDDTPGSERNLEDIAGFDELDGARDDVVGRLIHTRAESLTGLRAKARGVMGLSAADPASDAREVAQSLARDLLGVSRHAMEPRADPIFAALAECDRLNAPVRADAMTGFPGGDPTPEHEALGAAAIEHWRNVVLKTVPHTAEGCKALARATAAHHREWACTMDGGAGAAVLDLIARSPLL